MAKKIVITSGKGGVGKTTITSNLGCFLAKMGQRVVLVDVDFGLNNLDVVSGVENKIIYDIKDVFVQYENNNKKHIVSYVSNGIPLVVFKEAYGFRQCKFTENNLLGCLQERIGSKSYIENIFQ